MFRAGTWKSIKKPEPSLGDPPRNRLRISGNTRLAGSAAFFRRKKAVGIIVMSGQ